MRIGLIQLNAKIGDFENNRLAIQNLADSVDADLFVCPELSLSGYHARDLFTRKEFVDENERQLALLTNWSKDQKKSIWVGHIFATQENSGLELYNAASLIVNGNVVARTLKHRLPNYNIFEEKRYFTSAPAPMAAIDFMGHEMCAEICEDSWTRVQKFSLDDYLSYGATSAPIFGGAAPRILVNLSASPFVSGKAAVRRELLSNLSKTSNSTVIYVNYSGAQDELVFDGQSSVYAADGKCLFEAPGFESGVFVVDINQKTTKAVPLPERERWADIHQSLCTFVRDYTHKTGFKQVVLGLSGGIDSAVCAAICVDALGPENVLGVGLSSRWTSDLSRSEALHLANNLSIQYQHLEIETGLTAVSATLKVALKPLSQENIQSRFRGLVLMTLSNNQDRLLISTANKSEIAMGYSTLYGDMCGALMPIGDLYKTEVYGLAHYLNFVAKKDRIPLQTINREPSAELAAGQKDSDSLPEYAKLDAFLEMYLEYRDRLSAESARWDKLLAPFTSEQLVRKIQLNEFKRIQAPLICKVHHRSFGKHWTMPIAKSIDLPTQVL